MIKQDISNTIKLLDKMASDAKLLDVNNLQNAIDDTELSEEVKSLINEKNSFILTKTLHLDKLIVSQIVHSPDEDEDETDSEGDSEQTKESVRAFA